MRAFPLELYGIAKLYDRTPALRATTLSVQAGQTLALLGSNGSGKTTLLKIVAGAIRPTLGRARVFGRDIIEDQRALRGTIGLLAADTHLYDDLTARENVRFYATMSGITVAVADIDAALDTVDLRRAADERARTFSSGMKRRLSLARLLVLKPRLLLLDEPYNNLDVAGADLVDRVVYDTSARGGATVLATHDAGRACAIAHAVAHLRQGSLTYFGTVAGYRDLNNHVG